MHHALLISPVSQLPTVVNTNSLVYAELIQSGYQTIQTGTKRQLQALEEELMQDFAMELELNQEIN